MVRHKRGQIQISFGMIFSMLIIIATIVVAFYVIKTFFGMSNCTTNGVYWESLTEKVNKAWESLGNTQQVYTFDTPSGVTKACFGNFTQMPREIDKKTFEELKKYEDNKKNSYLYPSEKACEGLAFYHLNHVITDNFFCVPVKSGKVSLKLSKTDILVKLSAP